jgi:ergothioneine biosynthesis protein EgtB
MILTLNQNSGRQQLIAAYEQIRQQTENLCKPLLTDDYQIQSILQTSPPKWHIAHMSWLFEAFILTKFVTDYQVFDQHFDFIFNSYYYTHGKMHPRAQRGLLSRPSVEVVYQYRAYVDENVIKLIKSVDADQWPELAFFITLGLNHEQQHQELLLMDIKHNFSINPLRPAYRDDLQFAQGQSRNMRWLERSGGIHMMGHTGNGFGFDNETPRHEVVLQDHRLADRFITNAEYLEFIQAGAYKEPVFWLSDGWAWLQQEKINHPLYWHNIDNHWMQFTLGGMNELNINQPVCHVSYYEADAYARWAGKRLPLESELESMLATLEIDGNFVDSDFLHPCAASDKGQWFGDLWAWTASAYSAYPGFKPLAGSIGEYNGKFMSNQMVLKGGSCVTPVNHTRASYRNFFYPDERWAFNGIRLAEDA